MQNLCRLYTDYMDKIAKFDKSYIVREVDKINNFSLTQKVDICR